MQSYRIFKPVKHQYNLQYFNYHYHQYNEHYKHISKFWQVRNLRLPFHLFVCVCVCVYVCHGVCPDDLTMKDWCHTNNILQVHCLGMLMLSGASYVSCTHDVIDDVTRSQSRSNFEIDISPSIFELEHRSKAQNVGNAHGYISGIFNFRNNFR